MKRILFSFLLISLSLITSAQWFGDGLTAGTAYYGVINAVNPMSTWNTARGTVFVGRSTAGQNDLEVASGGTLTIEQGITVKFCTTSSDLRITGTGILNASGSSSSLITFTKDTQATWGHISFEASTGSSIINYCIIENGLKTGSGIEGFGGGIHANTSNLIVSNSIVRYNTATYGGGIFVNKTQNPSISNCIINNNIASLGGGGLYFWNTSSSVVTNCLIYNNSVTSTTSYGGGGILFGPTTGSVKVINCTLAHNTAGFKANEVYFYSSPNARVINSILWGSNMPYFGTTSSSFVNCAIQGGFPSGSVGCINLNSDNTNIAGPNFTITDGSDWSIKFISPCRDAGTTPSPTIPNDYIGNSRIGPYDIGAYEVQYSRWLTNASAPTSWTSTSNWEQGFEPGHSGTTGDVVIPSLTSSSFAPDISGIVSISTGKYLILNPGAMATIGTISNSGTLNLESSATGISSLKVNTVSGNQANVQLFLTGGYIGNPALRVGRWHYISSPFDPSTPLSISPFTANTYDLARWRDGIQSPASILLGFVGFDGFVYNDSDPLDPGTFWGGTFSTLITGRGYNFWDNLSSFNYSLTGKLNTSDVAVNLDFAGAAYENGYNLLGNPFSSGLNWDDIINSVYFTYPSNTSKSLYFTRNNESCTYIAGVGVPGDVTGIIPPIQGFFTKTYSTGNVITLAAAARVHDSIPARYKGQTIIPLVRLEIDKDSLSKDETVVRFDDKALSTLDNEFDALKLFLSASTTSIYSSDGVSKYSINGQPFPATEIEIPVVINLQYSGNHKISTNQLQGLDNYYVTLKDNTTGFIADLKTTPELSFSAAAGTTSGRFILKIINLTTGVENPVVSNNIFNIYPGQNLINIQTIADEWDGKSGSVRLLDLTGKTVTDLQNAEFRKNSVIQMQAPAATGLYVVEIRSGVKRYVGKVIIK